jgi:hypothetical protein
MQSLNLKLKLYIVFGSWSEKLCFSTVANILKISVRSFFWQFNTLSISAPNIKEWGTNGHLSCSKTEGSFLLLKINFDI